MPEIIDQRDILFRSIEADIMVENSDEKSEMVEGAIGEMSAFHNTFGYYAQAVDSSTSVLPNSRKDRVVKVCNEKTHSITGLCLEIHDLMISKLYAGREKDLKFFNAAVSLNVISKETLIERLNLTEISDRKRHTTEDPINRGFSK